MNLTTELSRTDSVVSPCHRKSLISVVILGVLVLGGLVPAVSEDVTGGPGEIFEQHDVALGDVDSPTVLTGFLLGGARADLAVVDVDKDNARRLKLYSFGETTWNPVLETTLDREVLFVDVANIRGRDRLIMYGEGGLDWFDPEATAEQRLIDITAGFDGASTGLTYGGTERLDPSYDGTIPHVDITRDLNHDGRDDLVIPDFDGFWISTQSSDGSFDDFVKLGPGEPFLDHKALDDERTYRDVGITALTVPWYLSRVHEMDYDHDGRSDLVFWNEDHFDVHLQDDRGQFDPVPQQFGTEVSFDSDGAYSLIFAYGGESTFSLLFGLDGKKTRKVLRSVEDLNGDRVADLVTLTNSGRSLLRQRSVYEVHFGTPTAEGTRFAAPVDIAIQPRGRAAGMQFSGYSSQWIRDLDGDGQTDFVFRDVAVGLGGVTRTLVGKSVPVNLELYRIDDAVDPEEATTRRKVRRFSPFDGFGNIFFPAVLVGDVNGDGRSDMLVGQSPRELQVFFGMSGSELLAAKPQKVEIDMPYDERNTWLADLDNNGKQDLVMQHMPTGNDPDVPYRLTILVAR